MTDIEFYDASICFTTDDVGSFSLSLMNNDGRKSGVRVVLMHGAKRVDLTPKQLAWLVDELVKQQNV